MPDCVLALDIGTSSARAIAFDMRGRAIDGLREQVRYEPHTASEGSSEFDGDKLVEHAAHCIDKVLAEASTAGCRIAAVGATTFWHSMAGAGEDGSAVTPIYTWADTRSESAVAGLRERLDPAGYHARTGCALHSSYFPARLAWLSHERPELFHRVKRWMSPGEYLYLKLFGEAQCSVSMASGTGLLNQNAADWDDETLDALPVTRENLNALSDIDSPVRGLREPWRSRWPALADVPWVPAIGDGAASNLGSGCDSDRRIAINLGTSGAIRVLFRADRAEIPTDLWCYRLDRGRFVMGGAFSDGGSVYAWMRETLNLSGSDDEIELALAGREPFGHGITFLPFLSGERSTGWRPDATATVHGLRLSTTPLDVLQAALEGVALRFALVAASLRRVFPNATEIRASGGALGQSQVWAQIICDAIGQSVQVTAEAEASSRGAALAAIAALGCPVDDEHTPVETGQVLTPDARRHAVYQEALAVQQDLYRRLAAMPFK
jgi:gluconokinase